MKQLTTYINQFIADDDGATATEYAVVVSLIIISVMAAVLVFGNAVTAWFNGAAPTVGALPTN